MEFDEFQALVHLLWLGASVDKEIADSEREYIQKVCSHEKIPLKYFKGIFSWLQTFWMYSRSESAISLSTEAPNQSKCTSAWNSSNSIYRSILQAMNIVFPVIFKPDLLR